MGVRLPRRARARRADRRRRRLRCAVVSVAGYDPDLPSFAGTQYLIVTHPRFCRAGRAASPRLKQAEGLRAEVVTSTRPTTTSRRASSRPRDQGARRARTRGRGRLRYVLLVGDDSFDPRDYVGSGAVAFVPSLAGVGRRVRPRPVGEPLRRHGRRRRARRRHRPAAGADARGGRRAGRPRSRRRPTALAAVAGRHLFVTDDSSEDDAPFRDDADARGAVAARGQRRAAVRRRHRRRRRRARQALQDGWQQGAAMTHYFGHGGHDAVGRRAAAVRRHGRERRRRAGDPTVLFAWACLSQFYQNFWGPSINEALLLLPNGGTLASFGPAGISSPGSQRPLVEGVYRNLRPARGSATRRASQGRGAGPSPGWTARRSRAST